MCTVHNKEHLVANFHIYLRQKRFYGKLIRAAIVIHKWGYYFKDLQQPVKGFQVNL